MHTSNSAHTAGSSTLAARQSSILAIDDDDDSLMVLGYVMESLGHDPVLGRTGQEALTLAIQHKPRLILLDILLPDINGIAVIQQLRQIKPMRRVPIIAVTALARPSDIQQCMKAGFSDYLIKPFMLDRLEAMVAKYLR